jgi:hypothetical protein
MTHTKGPWRIGDAGNTVFGPPCGLPPQRIADLSNTKDRHANSRLIAAAPDLLEALKYLTAQIDLGKLNVRKDFSLINAHASALQAIFKATGKEEQ